MELLKQLGDLKLALSKLGISKVTSSVASKLSKILAVCKFIARVLTVVNQTQKENLRKFCKGKKYKPLDLQPKKAHAAGSTSMRRIWRTRNSSGRNSCTTAEDRGQGLSITESVKHKQTGKKTKKRETKKMWNGIGNKDKEVVVILFATVPMLSNLEISLKRCHVSPSVLWEGKGSMNWILKQDSSFFPTTKRRI